MTALAELIRLSPVIYFVITALDVAVYCAGSIFITVALFHLSLRKKPAVYAVCAAMVAASSAADTFAFRQQDDFISFLAAVLSLVVPYLCAVLVFQKKGVWKALLVTAGYTFIEAIRFIVLLVFFGFDNNNRNDALEVIVEFLVDVAAFLLTGLLLARWAKRHTAALHVTRTAAVLFLLGVASVAVFVTSLMLMGSEYTARNSAEFGFMLMNIPVLTATVTFALVSIFKMRVQNENYKAQLDMQIRQYQWMEQMNEDLRVFRHDFPKKMRPLINYLAEDKPQEALQMAEQFSDYVAATGARFHTGNTALDTVLMCEQQVAERQGVTLNVPFDTAFPAEGVSSDDIYTIFPNALDNAIEACAKLESGERTVEFRSHVSGNTVFVSVQNPMSGKVRTRGGVPQTDKADKKSHGYGFRSIKKASANYGKDNVSFTAENGVFELLIFLELPAKKAE